MKKIQARQIYESSAVELDETLPMDFILVTDDGVETPYTKEFAVLNHFLWEFNRRYPELPLLAKHTLAAVMNGNDFNPSTVRVACSNLLEHLCEECGPRTELDIEDATLLIQQIFQRINNEIEYFAERSVATVDILDFIQIQTDPEVKRINEGVTRNNNTILAGYGEVNRYLMSDPKFKMNNVVDQIRSKLANPNQLSQCISNRGYGTETTGSIFENPIMSSFTEGMYKPFDLFAVSRDAATAAYNSEDPLKMSEWFARTLQLVGMNVTGLAREDCGSTKYASRVIRGVQHDEDGKLIYHGDVKFMVGKIYTLDPVNPEWRVIKGNEVFLVGQRIYWRSSIYCNYRDPHKVCEVCYGKLSVNVSRHASLGHLCCATMSRQTTQATLGTKHLVNSSSANRLVVNPSAGKFFRIGGSKNSYALKPDWAGAEISLKIKRDDAPGLTDIFDATDEDALHPLRVSHVDKIYVGFNEQGDRYSEEVSLAFENKSTVMTLELLQYLKQYGWESDRQGFFIINLKDWDFSKPLFKLPETIYSHSDHSKQVRSLIESSSKELKKRHAKGSPERLLHELFDLVNSKLDVNIAALEVIVYAYMVPEPGKYGMARGAPDPVLDTAANIIQRRSLSNAYAYQELSSFILSPISFKSEGRPDSIFDVFFVPDQALRARQDKNSLANFKLTGITGI